MSRFSLYRPVESPPPSRLAGMLRAILWSIVFAALGFWLLLLVA